MHFIGEADGKPLHVGETVRLRFLLENRGYWYAQPAATNLFVFVNCAPGLEPIRMRFGTGLEAASDQVRPGKGETKYLLATGITLFCGEPGEEVELELRLPERAATYTARIAIHSDRGEDCGVHRFRLRITRPRLPRNDSQ